MGLGLGLVLGLALGLELGLRLGLVLGLGLGFGLGLGLGLGPGRGRGLDEVGEGEVERVEREHVRGEGAVPAEEHVVLAGGEASGVRRS